MNEFKRRLVRTVHPTFGTGENVQCRVGCAHETIHVRSSVLRLLVYESSVPPGCGGFFDLLSQVVGGVKQERPPALRLLQ